LFSIHEKGQNHINANELACAICFGEKEPIGFVAAAHIHGWKPCLAKNSSRQVASLSDLTVQGDFSVEGDFTQARTQFINRNVHGSRKMPSQKLLRCSHIKDEGTL
jgi:hypothetical protein